jgi:methyl coenzyme M reductase subunit C
MHHDAYHFRRLEKSIIPEGGVDAADAVSIDSKLSEATKSELKAAIHDIMAQHERGENADKDKVQDAIVRIERFLDRAEGVGRTVGRVVGFATAAGAWARRTF